MKAVDERGIYAWKIFIRKELEPRLKALHKLCFSQDSNEAEIAALEGFISWCLKSMRYWLEMDFKTVRELNELGFFLYKLDTGDMVWDLARSSDRAALFRQVVTATKATELKDSLVIFRADSEFAP